MQRVRLWFWRGVQRKKLHHHTLPFRVTPTAQVMQRTGKSALSLMTKLNTVLEAHQNARSWARVPRAILSSAFKSRFFTCCWLPFCSLGHLSSFSDTHSPGRAAALGQPGQTGTCMSCVHTSTLPEVLGFAEARNMSSLDSVG